MCACVTLPFASIIQSLFILNVTFQNVLDSVRASNALNRIARKLRQIHFLPGTNLHNICQFQRMMAKFCEHNGALPDIEYFGWVQQVPLQTVLNSLIVLIGESD